MSCNKYIDNFIANQNIENLTKMFCHHTKVTSNIIRDFDNPYSLDGWLEITEDDDDQNDDKKVDVRIIHSKLDKSSKSQNLAVVFIAKKVSVLYTTGRQVTPTCSSCSSVNCSCVRAWKGYCKKKEENDHNEQADNDDESPGDNDENVSVIAAHYLRKQYQYGHNNSSISFPLYSCPKQKLILEKKQAGSFSLPPVLIPTYDPLRVCKHNKFKEDDNYLKLCARY